MAAVTTDLLPVLVALGVEVTQDGEDELIGHCPLHAARTGRQDRSPSWSMNRERQVYQCFSCGDRGTLRSLVEELQGLDPFRARAWLRREGVKAVTVAPPAPVVPPRIRERALEGFCEPPDRALAKRHLERFAAAHYGVRWDERRSAWILPLHYPDGTFAGYQFKKSGYVRNHPPKIQKARTVFGLDKLRVGMRAVLVESPLDVVRLYGEGIEGGVASMGAYVSAGQMQCVVAAVGDEGRAYPRLVLALDNDRAGRQQTERLWKSWRRRCSLTVFDYGDAKGKDIGELSTEEIKAGLA